MPSLLRYNLGIARYSLFALFTVLVLDVQPQSSAAHPTHDIYPQRLAGGQQPAPAYVSHIE
jgi:hypothetical protein